MSSRVEGLPGDGARHETMAATRLYELMSVECRRWTLSSPSGCERLSWTFGQGCLVSVLRHRFSRGPAQAVLPLLFGQRTVLGLEGLMEDGRSTVDECMCVYGGHPRLDVSTAFRWVLLCLGEGPKGWFLLFNFLSPLRVFCIRCYARFRSGVVVVDIEVLRVDRGQYRGSNEVDICMFELQRRSRRERAVLTGIDRCMVMG